MEAIGGYLDIYMIMKIYVRYMEATDGRGPGYMVARPCGFHQSSISSPLMLALLVCAGHRFVILKPMMMEHCSVQ